MWEKRKTHSAPSTMGMELSIFNAAKNKKVVTNKQSN